MSARAALASGALVRRELLTTLRGMRSFIVLLLFAAMAGGFALISWPESHEFGRGSDAFNVAGHVSRQLVHTFSYGLLAACLLLVPTYAASAIVLERERGTIDFLSVSLVRPAGIVRAKMWNALGFFLLLCVAVAPVLALAFFLVGVDPVEFGKALGYILATSLSACGIGLFCSARFRRAFAAIGASLLGILFLLVGPLIMTFIVAALINAVVPVRAIQNYLEIVGNVTSPPGVLAGIFGGDLSTPWFAAACLMQLAIATATIGATVHLVSRPMNPPKIEHRKPIDDAAELERRRKQFPYYLIDPLKRKKPIEDDRNPMLVREMRWGFLNRGSVFVRVFYIAFAVYFFVGVVASADARSYDTMSRWLVAQMIITVLAAPALMANALTKEYELGNIDMLRTTLLKPDEIILGKLFAGATTLVPALVAATLSCIPVVFLGGGNLAVLALGYGSLLVCCAVSLSLGLVASLLVRKTIAALVVSYLFNIAAFGGFALLLRIAYYTVGSDDPPQAVVSFLSPILAFMHSIEGSGAGQGWQNLELGYWTMNVAAYLLIAAVIVLVSIQAFRQFRMQDR